MNDEFTERCAVCQRIAYHCGPMTDGICSFCTPNPDRDLAMRIMETYDQPQYLYSPHEYRRAIRYLWNTLNPDLHDKKKDAYLKDLTAHGFRQKHKQPT